jgi:phosphatidylglycerophosphate synthase
MGKAAAKRFQWLPNALTSTRLILGVPILLAAVNDAWTLAFGLFALALITDFLDGLAAKKLNAYSKLGEELDPIADASLVVAGFLALSVTGNLDWWITILVFVIGGGVGMERFIVRRPVWALVFFKILSVGGLFIEWTVIAWMFAALAFGWSWVYVPIALAIIGGSALLKRHRIRSWLHPESPPAPPSKR